MININVGDSLRNSVNIMLVISKIDEENGIATLTNHIGEVMPYNLKRLLENIASGKWTYYPKKKYANWI